MSAEGQGRQRPGLPRFWTGFLSAVTLAFLADLWRNEGDVLTRSLIYLMLAGPAAFMVLRYVALQEEIPGSEGEQETEDEQDTEGEPGSPPRG